MMDIVSGRSVGTIAIGTFDSVDINQQLQAARGRQAASIHTHPRSSSFSPADVQLLIEESVLTVVAVIGADRTWYVLSVEPGAPPPAAVRMEAQYDAVLRGLAPAYRALVHLGTFTREAAWRELTHVAWEHAAPGLGLRYDRIKVAP